jgi:hypothetical protein
MLDPDTYSEIAQIMPSLQSCLKPPMKSNAIAHRINKLYTISICYHYYAAFTSIFLVYFHTFVAKYQ